MPSKALLLGAGGGERINGAWCPSDTRPRCILLRSIFHRCSATNRSSLEGPSAGRLPLRYFRWCV